MSSNTYECRHPADAIFPKDIPGPKLEIVRRMVRGDTQSCLLGERLAAAGKLGEEPFAIASRPYVPGEMWPDRVPSAAAAEAVVFAALLDPARGADAQMIKEWGLGAYVKRPCLFRFCVWPYAKRPIKQVVPLPTAEAKEYRQTWQATEAVEVTK